MLVIIRRLVLVAMLPIALSGCDLLAYTMFPGLIDPELTDPELVDPELTGQTSFRKGSATVDITRSGVGRRHRSVQLPAGLRRRPSALRHVGHVRG